MGTPADHRLNSVNRKADEILRVWSRCPRLRLKVGSDQRVQFLRTLASSGVLTGQNRREVAPGTTIVTSDVAIAEGGE